MRDEIERAATEFAKAVRDLPFLGMRIRIEHDGFAGKVIGFYVRDDGARGVVLQLNGAKVVHVYGEKWLIEEL